MYRAPKSPKILRKAILLLSRHPEHIDAFVTYFGNYAKSKQIVEGVTTLLKSGFPYAYVRGELWHLLARLATSTQLGIAMVLARQDAKDRKRCLGLSWGVMHFLIRCEEEGLCRIGNRLKAESPASRALLASKISLAEYAPKKVASTMLKGAIEEQLAIARQLQVRNISLAKLNLRQRDLPEICQHSLRSLGVIRRVSRTRRDWIAERLRKRYGNDPQPIWRSLLDAEYEHALQILIEADAIFDIAPSHWIQVQDSFNDVVVRQFIFYLEQRGLPGGTQRTVGSDGRLVKYGQLLQHKSPFEVAFPAVSVSLQRVHDRRNHLPGSHPYDEKGGAQNRWLTMLERDTMLKDIAAALCRVATYISKNP